MGIWEFLEIILYTQKKESHIYLVKVGSTLVLLFSSSRSLNFGNFHIFRDQANLDHSLSIDFMVVS